MLGVQGPKLTRAEISTIQTIKPGGLILFQRNIVNAIQTKQLIDSVQSLLPIGSPPLLVAVDQEGGRVARVRTSPPMISPMALGKLKNVRIIKEYSELVGHQLRAYGINTNLAPVLDVRSEVSTSFIGERSFSSSPTVAAAAGFAFSEGQLAAGILPVSKHFPGGGSVISDVHIQYVEDSSSLEEIKKDHLAAFRQSLNIQPSGVMMSHVVFPALDSVSPTFSRRIVRGLLRKDLGYRGLVFSDDLKMDGAKGASSVAEATARALHAGVNVVLISWSPRAQLSAFRAAQEVFFKDPALANSLINPIIETKNTLVSVQTRKQNQRGLASQAKTPNGLIKSKYNTKELAQLEKLVMLGIFQSEQVSKKLALLKDPFVLCSSFSAKIRFEQGARQKVDRWIDCSLPSERWLESLNSSTQDQGLLLFVSNRKMAEAIADLPSGLKERSVVVSTVADGFFPREGFQGVISIGHPLTGLWNHLGKEWRVVKSNSL